MCKIRDGGKVKARDRIAVLASLNLAFDLSDRPAQPARPTPPPASTAATNTASSADSSTIDSLLRRLDAALGEDGRLI